MKVRRTDINGVAVVETSPFIDRRGLFARLFYGAINHEHSRLGEQLGRDRGRRQP